MRDGDEEEERKSDQADIGWMEDGVGSAVEDIAWGGRFEDILINILEICTP